MLKALADVAGKALEVFVDLPQVWSLSLEYFRVKVFQEQLEAVVKKTWEFLVNAFPHLVILCYA